MIGIIDYGVGNLRSVQKALERIGAHAEILPDPKLVPGTVLKACDKLILPGVGAFADGMAMLAQRGWIEPVRQYAASGKPLLGICLGLQLMFEGSEEDAPAGSLVPGLGLLPGKVVRFSGRQSDGRPLKVPHMGWNTIRSVGRADPLLAELPKPSDGGDPAVYFVHGYFVQPRETPDNLITSSRTDYGSLFTATVWSGNLWATQFHPEKSQQVGLRILKNFAAL